MNNTDPSPSILPLAAPVISPNKMAEDATESENGAILKKMVYQFFLKASSLLENNRVSKLENTLQNEAQKLNNWFNISTDTSSIPYDQIKPWKQSTIEASKSSIPPLIIETYLDLRDIHPKQKVYLNDKDANPWFVTKGKKKTEVVLERWLFEFEADQASAEQNGDYKDEDALNEELSSIYKKCIVFFRNLFTCVNLLPATDLRKAIGIYNASEQQFHEEIPTPQEPGQCYQNLKVNIRLLNGLNPISSRGRVGLSKELISTYANISNDNDDTNANIAVESFDSIKTPRGILKGSVQYRKDTNFFLNKRIDPDLKSQEQVSPDQPLPTPKTTLDHEATTNNNSIQQQQKRVSILSNQLYSPSIGEPPEYQPKQVSPNPSGGDDLTKKLQAKAIPIINRSSSNVSLAALLRSAKSVNQTGGVYGIGSYSGAAGGAITGGAAMSIPKSFTSSYGGSLISNNNNNIMNINQPSVSDFQVGSAGKYSSSFSSRHQLPTGTSVGANAAGSALGVVAGTNQQQRKSLLLGNVHYGGNLSRNPSLDSSRRRDSEVTDGGQKLQKQPPGFQSNLFADDDITDFIKSVDNKADLKVGGTPTAADFDEGKFGLGAKNSNLNDYLVKFKSMRTANNLLSESLENSALINNSPQPSYGLKNTFRSSRGSGSGGDLGIPQSTYSGSSYHSVAMNKGGSYSSNISYSRNAGVPVTGNYPLGNSGIHRYSFTSPGNSPHVGNTDYTPLVPSRLSGTFMASGETNVANEPISVSPSGNDIPRHPSSYNPSIHQQSYQRQNITGGVGMYRNNSSSNSNGFAHSLQSQHRRQGSGTNLYSYEGAGANNFSGYGIQDAYLNEALNPGSLNIDISKDQNSNTTNNNYYRFNGSNSRFPASAGGNYINYQNSNDSNAYGYNMNTNPYDIGSAPLPIMIGNGLNSGNVSRGDTAPLNSNSNLYGGTNNQYNIDKNYHGNTGPGGAMSYNDGGIQYYATEMDYHHNKTTTNDYGNNNHNNNNGNNHVVGLGTRSDGTSSPMIDQRQLIANRYNPSRKSQRYYQKSHQRHGISSLLGKTIDGPGSMGIKLPSLQSSSPSMAIITTTNAYAKMNSVTDAGNNDEVAELTGRANVIAEDFSREDHEEVLEDDDGPHPEEEYMENIGCDEDEIVFDI